MVFGELHLLPLSDLTLWSLTEQILHPLWGGAGVGCKPSEWEGEKSVPCSIMKCLLMERNGDAVIKKSHVSVQYVAFRASLFHWTTKSLLPIRAASSRATWRHITVTWCQKTRDMMLADVLHGGLIVALAFYTSWYTVQTNIWAGFTILLSFGLLLSCGVVNGSYSDGLYRLLAWMCVFTKTCLNCRHRPIGHSVSSPLSPYCF